MRMYRFPLDVVPDNIATIEMAFNNRANAENIWLPVMHVYRYMAINMRTGSTAGNDIWYYYTMEDHYFSNTWAFGIANGYKMSVTQ